MMLSDAYHLTKDGKDAQPCTERLLIVSNRGPVEHHVGEDGRITRRLTDGGVATALRSVANAVPTTWIASATSPVDKRLAGDSRCVDLGRGNRLRLVAPPTEAFDLHYGVFCNPILWFLQHSLWDRLERLDASQHAAYAWELGYLPVNLAFAEAVVDEIRAQNGPVRVMLHDYHLYAAPRFIRNLCPRASLQHFIHIPWPSPDAWRELPREIVESICGALLANDSVVFQTESSAQNFLLTCRAFLPDADIHVRTGAVGHRGRRTLVWANPIAVDIWGLSGWLSSPEAEMCRRKLDVRPNQRTIVRVDRLDPSKNITAGFQAFDRLLREHPEWVERVKFLTFLVPSRTGIPEYRGYADEVFDAIRAINARHGRPGWTPIEAFYEQNRPQALAALSLYDVLLVNPIADGMNLVSKEGAVLNQRDGVLVLSTTAGSFGELREGALPVSPGDIRGTAEALHTALSLSPAQRRERAMRLRQAVVRHDLNHWLQLLLEDLGTIDRLERLPLGAQRSRRLPSGGLRFPHDSGKERDAHANSRQT
jgi:trehalose 6-phosphate synthase